MKRINLVLVALVSQIGCEPRSYDYHLFENFVLNEEIFRQENRMLTHFKVLRNNLKEQHAIFSSTNHTIFKTDIKLKSALQQNIEPLELLKLSSSKLFQTLGNVESNLAGSSRGLIMLQDTYNLDVIEMAKGKLHFNGKIFQVIFFRIT
jgi:hypothetical protein